jgi:hypothetical protein
MLVAGRDQQLVQRAPAFPSAGHRPLATLARAQAALLPSHGEAASAVLGARDSAAAAGTPTRPPAALTKPCQLLGATRGLYGMPLPL